MAERLPHSATARQAHHVVPAAAVVLIYTVVMAGGTLTIPLYVLWASKFGFGAVTTLVFIAYVIGPARAALARFSAPVFIVGTVFAGAAVGTLFRHGLGVTDALCDPGNRAELSATYFLFVYSGLVVPVLLLGLIDQAVGTGCRAPRWPLSSSAPRSWA